MEHGEDTKRKVYECKNKEEHDGQLNRLVTRKMSASYLSLYIDLFNYVSNYLYCFISTATIAQNYRSFIISGWSSA